MNETLSHQTWTEDQLRRVQDYPTYVLNPTTIDFDQASNDHKPINLSNGGAIYFGSTQPKKFYEIEQALSANNADSRVKDVTNLLHWFHSADEVSQTYEGNAYEKIEALLDRIYDDIGIDKVRARMKEQGQDPDKLVLSVNDTGCSFNVDYSDQPEFKLSLHEKGLGGWPGVELGPITDAQNGIRGFTSALNKMVRRMREEGTEPDLSAMDQNLYLFCKLTNDRKDIVIHSYFTEAPVEFQIVPEPANLEGVLTSHHFLRSTSEKVPVSYRNRSIVTYKDEYVGKYSAQALGMHAFLKDAGVPEKMPEMARDFSQEPNASKITYAGQHNVLAPDGSGAVIRQDEDIPIWENKAIHSHRDVRHSDLGFNSMVNGAYQDLTFRADAVILAEHHKKILGNYDRYFLDLFDLWCSLHVDKQLRVETFENTPFFVLNRKTAFNAAAQDIDWNSLEAEKQFLKALKKINPKKDPWLAFMLFNQYLHEKGFVKQEPRFLHTHLDSKDKNLISRIKRDVAEAQKNPIPFKLSYEDESWGKDCTDKFEVSILGSASTRVASYNKEAYDFGSWVASQGWHARSGGGKHGIMGAFADGVLDYMRNRSDQDPKAHFSGIQMPRTIQFEGAFMKQGELRHCDDKFLRVAPSFDERMESLFRSNVCVTMAPGIGTYQELARWMRLREAGLKKLQDKTMVVVNPEQPDHQNGIRLMDIFFALAPERLVKKHLQVVLSEAEARAIAEQKHQEWLRACGRDLSQDFLQTYEPRAI